MGKKYDHIPESVQTFIQQQHMFFVSTAAADGTINLSPKGGDSFLIQDQSTFLWLNYTGSGNETAAHLLELPRMTIMFCSFTGAPLIVRLYGTARCIHVGDKEWDEKLSLFPTPDGARQVVEMNVEIVHTSCGFGVPLYDYQGDRSQMPQWIAKKGPDGIAAYQQKENSVSLDGKTTGLPPL